jgi:hypothetical protein
MKYDLRMRGPTPVRCNGCGKDLNPEQWEKTLENGKAWCKKCYDDQCHIECEDCPDNPCWPVPT